MSDSNKEAEGLRKWLVENYPTEAVFLGQITENVNDIFQHLKSHPNFKLGESKPLSFNLKKRMETEYMELEMSPASAIFLGGMAKAISDIVVSKIIPNLQPATKECIKCKTRNNEIANYCIQCGELFQDK